MQDYGVPSLLAILGFPNYLASYFGQFSKGRIFLMMIAFSTWLTALIIEAVRDMFWEWLYQIYCTVWKWIFICLSWGWEICKHESFPNLHKCVTLLCWTCDICEGSGLRETASPGGWTGFLSSPGGRGAGVCTGANALCIPALRTGLIFSESRTSRKQKDSWRTWLHLKSSLSIVPFTETVHHVQMDSCHCNWGHEAFVLADKSECKSVTVEWSLFRMIG